MKDGKEGHYDPKRGYVVAGRTTYQPCDKCGSRHVGTDHRQVCMSCGHIHRVAGCGCEKCGLKS